MTIEKRSSVFSYVAAAALAVLAVVYVRLFISWYSGSGIGVRSILILLFAIGSGISAIGFLIKNKPVKITGLAFMGIGQSADFLMFYSFGGPFPFSYIFSSLKFLLPVLVFLLLVIAVSTENKGVGIAAVIVSVVVGLKTFITSWIPYYIEAGKPISFWMWIQLLLPMIIAVLVIFTLVKKEKIKPTSTTATTDSISVTDKLVQLKSLLDAGAITQEEFDAKKKQLLGL